MNEEETQEAVIQKFYEKGLKTGTGLADIAFLEGPDDEIDAVVPFLRGLMKSFLNGLGACVIHAEGMLRRDEGSHLTDDELLKMKAEYALIVKDAHKELKDFLRNNSVESLGSAVEKMGSSKETPQFFSDYMKNSFLY